MATKASALAPLLALCMLLVSCASDDPPALNREPGDGVLTPCLDKPNELTRPPAGQLPCELLPPNFGR